MCLGITGGKRLLLMKSFEDYRDRHCSGLRGTGLTAAVSDKDLRRYTAYTDHHRLPPSWHTSGGEFAPLELFPAYFEYNFVQAHEYPNMTVPLHYVSATCSSSAVAITQVLLASQVRRLFPTSQH